jgi:putative nucleotidyltransferase with HDIG domain
MAEVLPLRWRHVRAVATKAENLRLILGSDADVTVAACWLHDIGYAPGIAATGCHPLDGARFLHSLGVDQRVCGLVANHSGMLLAAESVDPDQFPDEYSLARDVVWYCDLTTSPAGNPVTLDERLTELRQRYASDVAMMRWLDLATSEIRAAAGRVLDRVALLRESTR